MVNQLASAASPKKPWWCIASLRKPVSLTCPKPIPESTLCRFKMFMASRSFFCAAKCARVKFCRHLLANRARSLHDSDTLCSETRIFLSRSFSKHLAQRPMAAIAAVQKESSCPSTGTLWSIRYLSMQKPDTVSSQMSHSCDVKPIQMETTYEKRFLHHVLK